MDAHITQDQLAPVVGEGYGSDPYQRRWVVAGVVLAANVMDLLDSTIVNVAGPSIRGGLGGSGSALQWLSAGYTLAFAVLLITGARLGDILGRRRLYLIGSAGFTIFSSACAAAPSIGTLIVFRVLQGAFGALMVPQGFGLIKEVFSDAELPKVLSVFGPVTAAPLLAAPVLAGALVDWDLWGTGWRLVFLINVPIGLLTLALGIWALPRGAQRAGVRLDIPGVALIGLALAAIVYALIEGRTESWPWWIFAVLAAGFGLLVVFVLYERARSEDALIERTLMSNRVYLSGIAVALAFFGAFGGLLLAVSLFGQLGEGWSAVHAGLALTPMVIGLSIGMVVSLRLAMILGRRLLQLGIGCAAFGAGLLGLTLMHKQSASAWDLVPGLVAVGFGGGMTFGQLFDFIMAGVGLDEVGSASGVLNAVQQLANALGVAVLGTIFFAAFGSHLPTDALRVTVWACLIPLAAAFGLVFLLPMHAREEQPGYSDPGSGADRRSRHRPAPGQREIDPCPEL